MWLPSPFSSACNKSSFSHYSVIVVVRHFGRSDSRRNQRVPPLLRRRIRNGTTRLKSRGSPSGNSGTPAPLLVATQRSLVELNAVPDGHEGGATHSEVLNPKDVPGGHWSDIPDWQMSLVPPLTGTRVMPLGQERSPKHSPAVESRVVPTGQVALTVKKGATQTGVTPERSENEKPGPHIGAPKHSPATGSSVVPVGQFPLVGGPSQKATCKVVPAGHVGSAPSHIP